MNKSFIKPQSVRAPRTAKVQPNQVLSLSDSIKRLQSGNSFGVQMHQLEYDGETDDLDVIDIDQSDPLTSKQYAVKTMREIHSSYNKSLEKKEQQPIPDPE